MPLLRNKYGQNYFHVYKSHYLHYLWWNQWYSLLRRRHHLLRPGIHLSVEASLHLLSLKEPIQRPNYHLLGSSSSPSSARKHIVSIHRNSIRLGISDKLGYCWTIPVTHGRFGRCSTLHWSHWRFSRQHFLLLAKSLHNLIHGILIRQVPYRLQDRKQEPVWWMNQLDVLYQRRGYFDSGCNSGHPRSHRYVRFCYPSIHFQSPLGYQHHHLTYSRNFLRRFAMQHRYLYRSSNGSYILCFGSFAVLFDNKLHWPMNLTYQHYLFLPIVVQ